MWHWLRKNLSSTQRVWMRLVGYSCAAHLLCMAALFLAGESSEHRSLDLSKVYDPHAKIVLLPFYKVAPAELNQHRGNGVGGGGKGYGKSSGSNGQRTRYTVTGAGRPATTLVHIGQSAAEKRAAEKKKLAEKRRIAQEHAEKKAKLLKKQREKKQRLEAQRAKIKEAARKKAELKKTAAEKKRAALEQAKLKKEKRKHEALEQKNREQEAQKAALEKAELEKSQQKIGQELENPSAHNLSEQLGGDGSASGSFGDGSGEENVIYVGRDEIDQYRENTELRDALAAVWHPPVGIEPDEPCKLEVVVDNNGGAERVTVEASSGILVYDSAAQAALYETIFPERQHGKVLHITFR